MVSSYVQPPRYSAVCVRRGDMTCFALRVNRRCLEDPDSLDYIGRMRVRTFTHPDPQATQEQVDAECERLYLELCFGKRVQA